MPVKGSHGKRGNLYLEVGIIWPDEEWLSDDKNIEKIQSVLPKGPIPDVGKSEEVTECDYVFSSFEEVSYQRFSSSDRDRRNCVIVAVHLLYGSKERLSWKAVSPR